MDDYLDDIFVGNEDPQKLSEDLKKLIWVLQEGDFPAQKIVSNNQAITLLNLAVGKAKEKCNKREILCTGFCCRNSLFTNCV